MLTLFGGPAHSRNEYLNDGTNSCSTGDFSVSIEQRDDEYNYRHNSNSNDYDGFDNDRNIRLTWRKYLGSACTDDFKRVQQENMELKQQLELMKMCGKVNNNPTLQRNSSFALLVQKCSGIVIPENKTFVYNKDNPPPSNLVFSTTDQIRQAYGADPLSPFQ